MDGWMMRWSGRARGKTRIGCERVCTRTPSTSAPPTPPPPTPIPLLSLPPITSQHPSIFPLEAPDDPETKLDKHISQRRAPFYGRRHAETFDD